MLVLVLVRCGCGVLPPDAGAGCWALDCWARGRGAAGRRGARLLTRALARYGAPPAPPPSPPPPLTFCRLGLHRGPASLALHAWSASSRARPHWCAGRSICAVCDAAVLRVRSPSHQPAAVLSSVCQNEMQGEREEDKEEFMQGAGLTTPPLRWWRRHWQPTTGGRRQSRAARAP